MANTGRDSIFATRIVAPTKWVTSTAFYRRGLMLEDHVGRRCGLGALTGAKPWEMKEANAKHKYVQFVTDDRRERKELIRALRFKPLPYPKQTLEK